MAYTFDGTLSKGFVLSKPRKQDKYKEEDMLVLEQEERLVITRKRDGFKMFVAYDGDKKVRLYTDGMNEVTDSRLNHAIEELEGIAWAIPAYSLHVHELSVVHKSVDNGVLEVSDDDDLGFVGSVMKSKEARALELQEGDRCLGLRFFGSVIEGGKPCSRPYHKVLETHERLTGDSGLDYISTVQQMHCSFAEACVLVRELDWEGLVLYDKDFRYTFETGGKTVKRPQGCWKWKPVFEDDFIVREVILRDDGVMAKELVLLQKDPETGKEFYCGKVGNLTNVLRTKFGKRRRAFVIEVSYESRYPKSGKLRTPKFVRVRTDKPIQDCVSTFSYSGS